MTQRHTTTKTVVQLSCGSGQLFPSIKDLLQWEDLQSQPADKSLGEWDIFQTESPSIIWIPKILHKKKNISRTKTLPEILLCFKWAILKIAMFLRPEPWPGATANEAPTASPTAPCTAPVPSALSRWLGSRLHALWPFAACRRSLAWWTPGEKWRI